MSLLTIEYRDAEVTPSFVRKDKPPNKSAKTSIFFLGKNRASDSSCAGPYSTQHCVAGHDRDCGE